MKRPKKEKHISRRDLLSNLHLPILTGPEREHVDEHVQVLTDLCHALHSTQDIFAITTRKGSEGRVRLMSDGWQFSRSFFDARAFRLDGNTEGYFGYRYTGRVNDHPTWMVPNGNICWYFDDKRG